MAARLCLGATARFSILQIPRFALPLLQPLKAPIVGGFRSKMTARELAAYHDDDFTMIYRFPYIAHAATLCRVKLYQTGLTVIMMPAMMALNLAEMATLQQSQLACAVCVVACTVLYIVSGFFRRLIGIMYLNESKNVLKISHLTFMGERRDTLVEVQDVVPLADTGLGPKTIYYSLKLYSSKTDFYYYILRYGGVVEPERFMLVFGEEALQRTHQKFPEN